MTSNERKSNWLDWLSYAGLAAALYVIYELLEKASWPGIKIIDIPVLVLAIFIGVASMLLAGGSLASVVASIEPNGKPIVRSCLFAVNRTVLTKYLPGKIWYVIGVSETLIQSGLTRRCAWLAVFLYQGVLVGTALLLGCIGIEILDLPAYLVTPVTGPYGTWGLVALLCAGISLGGCIIWAKRTRHGFRIKNIRHGFVVAGIAIALGYWILQGLSIWIILSVFHGEWLSLVTIFIVPAVYALGFLVLVAPGGAGIRELLFVQYFLYLGVPFEAAAGLALLARIAALVIEIGVWLIVHVMDRRLPLGRSGNSIV